MNNDLNINPNEKESQSQNTKILAYLENGGKITSLDALKKFGCMRLSARILDLKNQGHNIQSSFVKKESTGKKFKEYYLAVEK